MSDLAIQEAVARDGFVELIPTETYEISARVRSQGCSFGCTQAKCSMTASMAASDDAWATFIDATAGDIQF